MSNSAAPLPLRFFDFLRKPDGDMNMDSGVVPYIEEGFASAEFVEASVTVWLLFKNPAIFFCRIYNQWYYNYYISVYIGL